MAGHRERKTAFEADNNAFAFGTSAKGEVPGKKAGEQGQAEKASQKRRQQRKFQKENSFVPDGKNQSGPDCGKQNPMVFLIFVRR